MRGAFNYNGCNKLKINYFNSILAMNISAVFKFNSTSSSSADTNGTPSDFIKNFRQLATWQFNESLKETERKYLDGIGENQKRKNKVRKKKENI